MPDFLLEIGCEEIPARMLEAAAAELSKRASELIQRERLGTPREIDVHSTPRRVSLFVPGIAGSQADIEEELQGPALKIAFKDSKPTPAAEAFAKKAGVAVENLRKIETPKSEYLAAHVVRRGRKASDLLAEYLPKEIAAIYWPKSMYWRAGAPERFVRPVRWMVALLDGEVVPMEFAGVRAGNVSRGHRFFSDGVKISAPGNYKESLRKAKVIVDAAERRERIEKELNAAVSKIHGARWRKDDALLETVVNLTEWPSVILGSFEKEFLSLPEEILVTVMRDHQKYFAVEDSKGILLPHFLAVLNTDGDPEGLIRHGNERVLKARFNDARFFWQTDQKIPLRDRIDLLKAVTFQKDLGSYYEKTQRVEKLAAWLAEEMMDSTDLNAEAAAEAAWLCKTDLTTELVKEFTELQGVVGGLYARAQELGEAVADAIYDHYKPESQEDEVPRTAEGAVLSIADKADSIAGMFALGKQPTGSKDPFALRRQANGIVKTIAERGLRIGLRRLLLEAREVYRRQGLKFAIKDAEYEDSLGSFFRERLEFYLRDVKKFDYDVVNAVLAAGSDRVLDAVTRAHAVAQVRSKTEFEAIALSFKRIKNILRQAQEKKIEFAHTPDPELAREAAESALMQQAATIGKSVEKRRTRGEYERALAEIAGLRPALDKFFDDVMVMVEDTKLRQNRLALLASILRDFSTIADFSEIVSERKS